MLRYNVKTFYRRKSVNQTLSGMWEYPLTLVEAPMGYGKTTAVKEYLKDYSTEVLWLTLLDGSAAGFWNGFSRLFQKYNSAAANRLAEMGVPANSAFLNEAVRIIGNIELPSKMVIVLDDYHLLSSDDVDSFIELLVKSELSDLHIIIISRNLFGENTTELVLKGYCWLIPPSCFELSREEIVDYCRLCGVKLNPQETAFLHSYTEGWISAVYLCVLGLLQEGRIERQASLYELIEKVVYRPCSAEAQEFLLQLCIFDEFSLEQAEFIWSKKNAEVLLQQLVSQNAFIKYDQVKQVYTMHNIFTSYLRKIFNRQDLSSQQIAWKAAGRWHVTACDYIRAMDYFYQAGDFNSLLVTVELEKGHSISNEHKLKLIRYFSECPRPIKGEHPQACLIYAINLFSFNEIELFAQECREISEYIEAMQGEQNEAQAQLAGELELLFSFTKYNSIIGMSEHIQKASQLLKGPSQFLDRSGSWTFGAPSVLYMFYRESGQLAQAVQEINAAMPLYCRLTAGHGSGAEYVMQAEWYYNTGDFENAEITAHKARHIAQHQEQAAIELCALFLQLRLASIKGDLDYIMDTLQQRRDEIKQQGLFLYFHTWDLCEGFIYTGLNQEKKVAAWIAEGNWQDSTIYFPSYAFGSIIQGKALLLTGQYYKLLALSEAFLEMASVFPNLLGQVYTYIYESAAKLKLGHYNEAEIALRKALDIAAPDQMMMPFVENGEYIIDMLLKLQNAGQYPVFIDKICAILPSMIKSRERMSARLNSYDGKLPLTERELAIAELVATGLSNQAVGKTLHIAEVTVKKALQSIYTKLNISNRTALTKVIIEQK